MMTSLLDALTLFLLPHPSQVQNQLQRIAGLSSLQRDASSLSPRGLNLRPTSPTGSLHLLAGNGGRQQQDKDQRDLKGPPGPPMGTEPSSRRTARRMSMVPALRGVGGEEDVEVADPAAGAESLRGAYRTRRASVDMSSLGYGREAAAVSPRRAGGGSFESPRRAAAGDVGLTSPRTSLDSPRNSTGITKRSPLSQQLEDRVRVNATGLPKIAGISSSQLDTGGEAVMGPSRPSCNSLSEKLPSLRKNGRDV